jgi:fatty acid desaturase
MAPGSTIEADPASARSRGSDYANLLRQVQRAGLLDRRPGYYLTKVAVTVTLLIAGWAAFVAVGDSWWQVAVAAFLAFVFAQVGFVGHDAGHRQIFRSRRANYLLGLALGNLAIGLSYGWWVDKHTRHHAHPNQEGKDPDIGDGVLAFTERQAHATRGLTRFVAQHQRALFFPLLLLEGMQMHVASIQALAGRRLRHRASEALLLGVHVAGYLAAVLLVLPPVKAVVFIAVHQGLFGVYLGCAFAPNHKGMPTLTGGAQTDFLRRQVLTSRNVRGGVLTDFMLGGLNYQIEHHLFPSMPRPNLRRAQPLVSDFCQQHGIAYYQTTLVRSYAEALGHLHEVGRSAPP